MGGLLDDLEEIELAAGQDYASTTAATRRKAGARRDGDDGDLSMMYHFVRDFIEWPDES
jgi:hypothetical protein